MRNNSFEDCVKEIHNLPMTWYPALINEMIKAAYAKNVFQTGRAQLHVRQIEEKILGRPLNPQELCCGHDDTEVVLSSSK